MKISFILLSIASFASASAGNQATITSAASTTRATTTTSRSIVTTTHTSTLSRPTYFQVIARNSGTKYDGRRLLGTDQSLSNVTFGTLPQDVYPSSKMYLAGTNKFVNLITPYTNSTVLYGGYNCGDQQLCSYDGKAAFLVFGQADFPIYGYVGALCSAVQKTDGKFYLACSVTAKDKKVKYRKPIVDHRDGTVLLLPADGPLPSDYSFVDMEIRPLQGSPPATQTPCCPS